MDKITLESGLHGGGPHRVLLFCRSYQISDDGASAAKAELDKHEARLRDWVSRNIDGEVEIGVARMVDDLRPSRTIRDDLSKTIGKGKWNLILVTGLAHVNRLFYLHEYLNLAADEDTRIIAVSDRFDSGEPSWLFTMTIAALTQEFQRLDRRYRRRQMRYHRLYDPARLLVDLNWSE